MLEKARFLIALSQERSLDDLESDRLLCAAVERELMIIGEATYLLSETEPEVLVSIDHYREIIAMRHKLVHGYSTVLTPILRHTVENHLQPLVDQILAILDESHD